MQETYVFHTCTQEQLRLLIQQGYVVVQPRSAYELLRLQKKKITVVLYKSGKLVVQSTPALASILQRDLQHIGVSLSDQSKQPASLASSSSKSSTKQKDISLQNISVGSDETLKGDTFGGLVVVGAFFSKQYHAVLKQLGVQDSKKLTDQAIKRIAQQLLEHYPSHFSIQEYCPKEYNQYIKTRNITDLLNSAHRKVGIQLQQRFTEAKEHLVDKYPGCNAGTHQQFQAESYNLAVAAASIVARHIGLEQLATLSKTAGFNLPKGSTHVSFALEALLAKGYCLNDYAKLHFSNVKKAQDSFNKQPLSCSSRFR